MASHGSGNVRIGPVGIFTLIILLCLAVMAVLTAVTAHASYASAEKQASYTTATYDNESKGWEAVAVADEALSFGRSVGMSQLSAANFASTEINSRGIEGVVATSQDNSISIEVSSESGKKLSILIEISVRLRPVISSWVVTTEPESTENDDMLWISNQ